MRDGLLVSLGPGEWADVAGALLAHIDRQETFFQGARLALDVGRRRLTEEELSNLRAELETRSVTLRAVLSESATTQVIAASLGLTTAVGDAEVGAPTADPDDDLPAFDSEEHGGAAVLLRRTLRSGRTVRNWGHVIIIGDVNPGAEIIAGGDVVVWGRLRGMVHAGADGDEKAVVCALHLAPTQLRIAGYIAVSAEDKRRRPEPEMAFIREGRIVAAAWRRD